MRAGRLRHRITIEHLVAGSPAYSATGESLAEWTALDTNIAAEWITLRGNALFAAQQHHADVRGTWRVRWRDTITAQMRIVDRGFYYEILWVPPYDRSGKRLEMDLECSQGVSEG